MCSVRMLSGAECAAAVCGGREGGDAVKGEAAAAVVVGVVWCGCGEREEGGGWVWMWQ